MSNQLVSKEIRNANTNAVRARDHWRRQYKRLGLEIRNYKNMTKTGTWIGDSVILEALKVQANLMMLERENIKYVLRATAYPYADKVE